MIRHDLEQALLEMKLKLSQEGLQALDLFACELKKWNRKFNLTAIRTDSDIAVKHMVDSLVFASSVHAGEYVMDIGSGAGFPSIPLKIMNPDVRVMSVDAVGKKILFQKHISRLLALDGFEALHARVESLHGSHAGYFDAICSRAFSRLDEFVALAAPMLKKDGRLIAMKGPDVHAEIASIQDGLRRLGFEINSLQDYSLPMNKGERCLVTISSTKAHR